MPPGYRLMTSASVQGSIGGAPLSGEKPDRRRRFGVRGRRGAPPLVLVTEFIAKQRVALDAERLVVIFS